jgi:predicted permease
MQGLWQDVIFALRILLKSPGVTAVAVLSLGLGIGANTANFSLINAFLLRPLPVQDPERLVSIMTTFQGSGDRQNHTSYPDYKDLRDRREVFSGLAAHFYFPMGLKTGEQAEVILGQIASWDYFSVLGVKPFLGRTFLPEEDKTPGTHPVAILSYRLWKNRLGADPGILGSTILINSHPFTVVGVAPEGFRGLSVILSPDVWVPTMMARQVSMFPVSFTSRYGSMLKLVGRLRPGITLAQAQAATDVLAANLAREYPDSNETKRFLLMEADRNRIGLLGTTDEAKRLTAVLMGVVGLVLLIACFNVANLLLAKATGRQREIALRISLGAPRRRIVRQLLTESVLLSLLGGAAGVLIALWALEGFKALQPPISEFPIELTIAPDARVFGFTLMVSLASGVLFGLAPALQAIRSNQFAALKDQAFSTTASRGKSRLQKSFVVAEVALSLVLLITTGLLLRSLRNTLHVDPGFESRNGLLVPINLGFGQYGETKGRQFYRQVVERVQSLPGVVSAALALDVPLGQLHVRNSIEVDGYQAAPEERLVIRFNAVGPRYFETLGVPILRGRGFDQRDSLDTTPVAVINETMARRYWPGKDPIGRTIRTWDKTWEIVGVMKDGKYDTLDEPPQPYFCLPLEQVEYLKRVSLHVKTAGDPQAMVGPVVQEVQRLDPNLPVSNVMTMDRFLEYAVGETGGPAQLVGIFGALALALAMVGVYGVMAYSVSQRTHEFGVRIALGGHRRAVLAVVLRQGLKITLGGVALGLCASLAATRLLSSYLYRVSPVDPLTFTSVSLVLVGVALLACYIPARWAAKVDPMVALRHE